MKKTTLIIALCALALPSMAQKAKKKSNAAAKTAQVVAPETPPKLLEENNRLTPMHHYLEQWAGHWRDEMKVWVGENPEPTIYRLEKEGRTSCEGKLLMRTISGRMNTGPYEAYETLNYDNLKHKFVKTWFDNLGTNILVLEGTLDEKTNTLVFEGTTIDPLTMQTIKVRQVLHIQDPENQLLEVFVQLKDEKPIKTMEVKSTRN